MKVLNLYACLGGNRLLWEDCEVTAVELDPELARLYQERFPNDNVIIADAHEYLLNHFHEYDFIWSSPPCPSHSRIRISQKSRFKAVFPDMKLYEEIILLENYFAGKYVVENVISFYDPLIPPQKRGRHFYWANFMIPNNIEREEGKGLIEGGSIDKLSKFHDYDFKKYKGDQRLNKIARNLVDYKAGEAIFLAAQGIIRANDDNQQRLF